MWLIRKQTRLAGEIERHIEKKAKLRAEIADCDLLVRSLRQDLAQVEAAMGMHEVQVEPKTLRPIRPHHHKAVLRVTPAELPISSSVSGRSLLRPNRRDVQSRSRNR